MRSATSFPGMPTCDRTCFSDTSCGRFRCNCRHFRLRSLTSAWSPPPAIRIPSVHVIRRHTRERHKRERRHARKERCQQYRQHMATTPALAVDSEPEKRHAKDAKRRATRERIPTKERSDARGHSERRNDPPPPLQRRATAEATPLQWQAASKAPQPATTNSQDGSTNTRTERGRNQTRTRRQCQPGTAW